MQVLLLREVRRKRSITGLQTPHMPPKYESPCLPSSLPSLPSHEPRHPHPDPDLVLPREQVKEVRRVHHRHPPVQRPQPFTRPIPIPVRVRQHVARDERRRPPQRRLAVPKQLEAQLPQIRAQVRGEQARGGGAGARELPKALAQAAAEVEEGVPGARGGEARRGEPEAGVRGEEVDAGEAPEAEARVGRDLVGSVSLFWVSARPVFPICLDGLFGGRWERRRGGCATILWM